MITPDMSQMLPTADESLPQVIEVGTGQRLDLPTSTGFVTLVDEISSAPVTERLRRFRRRRAAERRRELAGLLGVTTLCLALALVAMLGFLAR